MSIVLCHDQGIKHAEGDYGVQSQWNTLFIRGALG